MEARHPGQAGSSAALVIKQTRVRYLILLTLFIITTFNYADRATLSVTGTQIRQELQIDALHMGYIFSAFSWAYVLGQLPSGWLLDRFGARRVYTASIALWSVFTLLQGTVGLFATTTASAIALFVFRFAMGAAESPSFPANAKVVASWFPTSERGTASAVFNSGQYFAAVAFTPLMAWITHAYGWHIVYVFMGITGMLLAMIWSRTMKDPVDHRWVNREELEHIRDGGGIIDAESGPKGQAQARSTNWNYLRQLLSSRMLVGVYLAQYCVNVLTYFFITWFPIYLVQARGMTILKAGLVASLPAICGFVGGVLGGVISDWLIQRGYSLTAARKIPIVGGMLLSATIIGCNYVSADWLVILLMSLAFFGKGLGALGWAVVADTSPKQALGLSGSLFNTFGNVAGIVTPIVIGYIVATHNSFNGALVFVGVNALVTMICYLVIVKEIKRFEFR